MSHASPSSNPPANGLKLPPWLVIVVVLGFLGVAWYQNRQKNEVAQPDQPSARQQPDATDDSAREITNRPTASSTHKATPDDGGRDEPVLAEVTPERGTAPSRDASPRPATTAKLENQTIRDFGKVVFKGTIDLQPTLDRIARGEKNTHRNDGSTFGNRERRLPQKQSGYYTEYVHPTKGISGPGPQRVITGKGGDIWYTPDHYETFKKIK